MIIWLLAAVIGVINALVLLVFEFIGIHITEWLWNDIFQTDSYRWLVLPVSVLLGLFLTATIKLSRDKRVVSPNETLIDDINAEPRSLSGIMGILAIGAASLIAGASLGPEASLMAASAAGGLYAARKLHLNKTKKIFVLASVGALLVAFIGSLILVLIPVILLVQEWRKQPESKRSSLVQPIALIVVAGVTALITVQWLHHLLGGSSFNAMPVFPQLAPHDFAVALGLGFIACFLSIATNKLVHWFHVLAQWFDGRTSLGWSKDWLIGIVFSLGLGLLYVFGGPLVQFSGNTGSNLLLENAAQYGVMALITMIIAKVLATAWSKGTGYRGGLVFPSVFSGVALGLLVGQLVPELGGVGAMIGGIAGMLTAIIGQPIIAGLFLIAMLPYKLWPVALCALAGTLLFGVVSKRYSKQS